MKYLKMLGLAAIAAAAVTAFIGVGSASAYTLCTTGVEGNNCKTAGGASSHYANGTKYVAESTHATLTVTAGAATEVTCTGSKVELEQTGTGSDDDVAVPGKVTDLTFSGCKTVGAIINSSCEVSTGSGYTGSIAGTSAGNGTLTVTSETSTTVTCLGGFFKCTYTTAKNGVTLNVNGNSPATVSTPAGGVNLNIASGGTGCGTGAIWHAVYTLKSPDSGALWVGTKDA